MSPTNDDRADSDRSGDSPGSVSNQNREETTPGGEENAGHAPTEEDDQHTPVRDRSGAESPENKDEGRTGGSGEASQATGHPDNAG